MERSKFTYYLPQKQIARYPLPKRTDSRLLTLGKDECTIADHYFYDLLSILQPGDLLVLNNTRVLPARFFARKKTGGRVELLLERIVAPDRMYAQFRASRFPKQAGQCLWLSGEDYLEIISTHENMVMLRCANKTVMELLDQYGHTPLPLYLRREAQEVDKTRYQTVYASESGAVAAPTAGLHFTKDLLAKLEEKSITLAYITLHISAATFQPVRVENITNHKMHFEYMRLSADVCAAISKVQRQGGRVIAVGTTVVRCLETAALQGRLAPYTGQTDLFIYPGFQFQVVDALVSNFHLPGSTLLMLVCAFGGYERVMRAYHYAIERGYRFYSYGDAMFLPRRID